MDRIYISLHEAGRKKDMSKVVITFQESGKKKSPSYIRQKIREMLDAAPPRKDVYAMLETELKNFSTEGLSIFIQHIKKHPPLRLDASRGGKVKESRRRGLQVGAETYATLRMVSDLTGYSISRIVREAINDGRIVQR